MAINPRQKNNARYSVTIVATWTCSEQMQRELLRERNDSSPLPFSLDGNFDHLVDLLEATGAQHGLEYFSVEVEQ